MGNFKFICSVCSVVGVTSLSVESFALQREYTPVAPNVALSRTPGVGPSSYVAPNGTFAPNPGIGPGSYTGSNTGVAYGYGGARQTPWVVSNGGYAYPDPVSGRVVYVNPANSQIDIGTRAPFTPTVRYVQTDNGVVGIYSYNWDAVPGVGYGGPLVNNMRSAQSNGAYMRTPDYPLPIGGGFGYDVWGFPAGAGGLYSICNPSAVDQTAVPNQYNLGAWAGSGLPQYNGFNSQPQESFAPYEPARLGNGWNDVYYPY